ncbi:autotransporter-associated beta strand repeat-containing protein [Candidatus Pelagibacter sp.]|uniref:autotransporter outer membrane beta-barrel domain-containing protein n=1 Tax=Candidatus Pelagibacter sp. TaxID=2024849 RepID=UPI003F868282
MKKKLFNFIQIFFLFFLFFLSFNYTNSFGACPTGANPNVTVSSDFQCKEGFIDINDDIKSSISFNITNNSTYYLQTYVDGSSPYTITKTGNGTLTFMDTNISNFSASTIISDGTVSVSDNNTLGTGTIILNGGTLSSFNTSARTLANSIQVQNSSTLGNTTNSGALTLSGDITFTDKNLTLTSNSNNTISNIDLGGQPNTLSIATGVTSTVSGNITNGPLTKSGSGSLVVSGNMTSNSPLVVGAGTLEIGGTLTSGNFTNTISNDGTLSINSSSNQILAGKISGSGDINKNGSGTLTISNTSNSYTGRTIIEGGTVSISNSANLGFTPGSVDSDNIILNNGTLNTTSDITLATNKGITLAGNGTINTDDGTTLTYGGVITSTGDLIKSGSGTLTLSGSSDYTGDTNINAGTLIITGALSNSTDLIIASDATLDLQVSQQFSSLDLNGTISRTAGTSSVTISGTSDLGGNVTTSGTQTYTGATTLSASNTLTTSNANISFGSTINSDGTARNLTINSGTGTTQFAGIVGGTNGVGDIDITGALDLNAAISNASSLSVSGTSNIGANVTTTGTQSYTGTTTLSGGDRTLQGSTVTLAAVTGGSNALTVTGNLDLDGAISGVTNMSVSGTSNIGANVTTTGTQSYSGTTTVSASSTLIGTEISAAAIALNDDLEIRNSSDSTLASVISGTGALTKSGSGALTLRGINTFDGDLTVSAGTLYAGLAADSGNQVIENNVTVSGGTLSGGATIGGNVTVATANLAPGNSIGTLTIDGNVTLGDNSTTTIEFNDTTSDKVVVSGNITLAGALVLEPANTTYSDATFTIFDGSGGSGNSLSGTFASTTVNNSSNLGDATTSISYDTVNRKVFLNIDEDGGVSSNTVKSLTTKNNFKDIAEVFDAATTGKTLEVANVLKASDSNSVNTELGKLKGTVLATTFTQPTLNHNNFNRALSSVTSSNVNTSLVSSFTSSSNELTLASLQDAGLYGDKTNFNEYFDYSDTSVLGFVKNNKNRSIFNDFRSEDSATFIRTYGTTADRDNINSNYTGYDSETTGILFGQQFKNDEETFTGYSYGFTGTDTDYKNNYGESKTYSVHASLFKQYDKKDHGLNLISGMYVSKTESERNVSVFGTSVNDKYVSDYWDVGVNQEVQYIKKYKFGEVSVSPSAKFNSTYVFKSDTEETGGELALNVDNENLFIVKPELGVSISVDLSKKENINNELSLAMFASQDHFIDGTTSNARYSSGSSFNVDLPRDQETYYSLGLGYNFLNKETDTSLMANAFLMQNEESDMNSNIFSLTFRKLFGDFAKGNVPPVIAKKPENDQEVIKEASPKDKNTIKKVEKTLEEFEENIEIVLKESPTEQEVAKVYESISNNSKIKRQLTLNDVYNNLSANCYAIENKLVHLVNYYDKQQLYKILDKCDKLSDPKIHLIANRLHQIQLDETTALQKIYSKYLRILSYVPFITFVAFIILAYEFIRRYIVNHFRAKNTI